MARKRIVNKVQQPTIEELFKLFVSSQIANGVSEKTAKTYRSHMSCISKHLDIHLPADQLTNSIVNDAVISMRNSGLAHNSISSYMRVFSTFSKWCVSEGYIQPISIPKYRDVETVKETYTEEELSLLLQKPAKNCDFAEFRNWAIVNFLLNCGCRSASVRNIQNCDVNLKDGQVILRHTKTGKIQCVPLCSRMIQILRDYMSIRGGADDEYLFCDVYGGQLSENGLKLAIRKYNQKRGVNKTSVHALRHSFAREFITSGGGALQLQHILGHSTLAMTKHYCRLYDSDLMVDYDSISPLSRLTQTRTKLKMQ